MSSGACIPQLLRVHFANVGHPDARLSPLSLNFFRETEMGDLEPVDGVVWAENGVGKSSIRTLLFSLLHPSIHDVMKASGGPLDNRKFELFFGPKDTSFVITEWVLPDSDQPNLSGFPEDPNRLVLGYVAHWPGGTRTSLSDLERHYFMFKPSGKTTFERLPVRGLARDCEPVNSAKEFLTWFRERSKYVEGRQTTVHKEWLNLLEDAGLDPTIFTYQLRMNSGQGGILGLFKNRINSATDFVHFFLETVLNPDIASDVVEVLNEKRRHVERQPQWEAECQFVDEAVPMLRGLQQAKGEFDQAEKLYLNDLQTAGGLVAGLQRFEIDLHAKKKSLAKDISGFEQGIKKVNETFLKQQLVRDWLKRKLGECLLVDAESEVGAKKNEHSQALQNLRLMRAATEYVEWQAKLDECGALERDLASRQGSYGDVEKELHQAGAQWATIAEAEIAKMKDQVEQAGNAFTQMRASLSKDMTAFNVNKIEMGRVREEIRGIQEMTQKREKALLRLVHSKTLTEGEALTAALARWQAGKKQAKNQLGEGQKRLEQLEKDREVFQQRAHQATVEITRVQGDLERLNATREQDEVRRNALIADGDLRLMFEMDEVVLGEEELSGRIKERIAKLQAEAYRLSYLLSDKKETLATIEQSDSRLYPPSPAVAMLLRTIREELHIPVFLGTEILDTKFPDDPEKAEAMLTQDPARYLGLMVHTPQALEQIEKLQDTIQRPAFPVQISLADGQLNDDPKDALVLKPGHRAAFNRNAAQAMIDPLRKEITEKTDRLANCQQMAKRLGEVHAKLEDFLADYPSGDLRDLLTKISDLTTRFANLSQNQKREEENLKNLEEEVTNLRREASDSEHLIRMADNACQRIQDFQEDHDTHFQEHARELAEKRDRLHSLEDESVKLEASLEEAQRQLSERQETIFNRKAALTELETESRGIKYRKAEAVVDSETTYLKAKNTYQLCLDRYLQVSEKDETLRARLEEKQAMADHSEMRFKRELGDCDVAAVEALLEEDALEDRISKARKDESLAAMAVGAAEQKLIKAKEALRQLQPLPDDFLPTKKDAALNSHDKLLKRQEEQQQKLSDLTQTLDELKDQLRESQQQAREIAEHLRYLVMKRDEIKNHIPDFTEAEGITIPEDISQIDQLLDGFWEAFRRNRQTHSKTKVALINRCDKLRDLAGDPRFQAFPNDKRDILKSRDSVLNLTDDIIKEFTIFREVIRTSLRMAEESVDAIVTRLDAGVSDAFYLLNQSKHASKVPETMEGWAGRAFLKIECKSQVGDNLSERKPLYERVIREQLKSNKPLRGLDLIKRAIDALVGEKGFKVVIMKPGYALKTQYHPITDVKGWSDGEKITSVILLYCTMVQLRAVSTGKVSKEMQLRKASNGMLFLDNPFGEANSLTFVKMQLLMARALNIQLVYTASGSHKHLMARFPRVIRLSQEAGSKTQKTFVKATDVGSQLRETVKATHVQAAHFGTRAS